MKKTVIMACLLLSGTYIFSQNDSLFSSVFVCPTTDLVAEELDSLVVTETPLLVSGGAEEYDYKIFVANFDTLTVHSFDLYLLCDNGESLNISYTMNQIDSDPTIQRIENSVFLPLGLHPYHESYTFSVTLKDESDTIITSYSETYSEQEP